MGAFYVALAVTAALLPVIGIATGWSAAGAMLWQFIGTVVLLGSLMVGGRTNGR